MAEELPENIGPELRPDVEGRIEADLLTSLVGGLHNASARFPHELGAIARGPRPLASRHLIRPFPLRKPVSAASPFALEI
jgi:hypothetical protein